MSGATHGPANDCESRILAWGKDDALGLTVQVRTCCGTPLLNSEESDNVKRHNSPEPIAIPSDPAKMSPETALLSSMFKAKAPLIIAAPMRTVSGLSLAMAVSNAGGLGITTRPHISTPPHLMY